MSKRYHVFIQQPPVYDRAREEYLANLIQLADVWAPNAADAINKARSAVNRFPIVQEAEDEHAA